MITWRHVPRKQACSLTLTKVRESFRAAAVVRMKRKYKKFRSVLNFQIHHQQHDHKRYLGSLNMIKLILV